MLTLDKGPGGSLHIRSTRNEESLQDIAGVETGGNKLKVVAMEMMAEVIAHGLTEAVPRSWSM